MKTNKLRLQPKKGYLNLDTTCTKQQLFIILKNWQKLKKKIKNFKDM